MSTPIEAAEECERVSQPRGDEAGRLLEAGAENIERAHYGDALTDLSRAAELAPAHAQIRSLLGVAMAYEKRDFDIIRTSFAYAKCSQRVERDAPALMA